MVERISSLDAGYSTGMLSLFPDTLDDKESLYEVRNNAETKLAAGLPYNGKKVIVESTATFPPKGMIRVGPPAGVAGEAELIYYDSKTDTTFKDLVRGFAGSKQNQWPSGSWATNAVTAEPHNAVKDAIINIESRVGLATSPSAGSLNKRLKDMESKFLSPKATFRAFPKSIKPNTEVKFQSFAESDVVRYLWDFGDGGQSVLENPTHTYTSEGTYTVKLHVITSMGAQGISTKTNYITVSQDEQLAFFYVVQARDSEGVLIPRTYRFVDQTDGEIKQRFWVFGDGENYVESDSGNHERIHTYQDAGTYEPSLLVGFANENIKRIYGEPLEVA
jgi:PKD repeat protein